MSYKFFWFATLVENWRMIRKFTEVIINIIQKKQRMALVLKCECHYYRATWCFNCSLSTTLNWHRRRRLYNVHAQNILPVKLRAVFLNFTRIEEANTILRLDGPDCDWLLFVGLPLPPALYCHHRGESWWFDRWPISSLAGCPLWWRRRSLPRRSIKYSICHCRQKLWTICCMI